MLPPLMDSIGHAIITTAVSDSPLAIVASGINLRYDKEGLMRLHNTLPEAYDELALGVMSHMVTNQIVHNARLLQEMRHGARIVLRNNSISDKLSHVAVEVAIDCLLLEEPEFSDVVKLNWGAFDWAAAKSYLPQFSRQPKRAELAISYVQQRYHGFSIDHAAQWLFVVAGRLAGRTVTGLGTYRAAAVQLTDTLRGKGQYYQLIRETQVELRNRIDRLAQTDRQ